MKHTDSGKKKVYLTKGRLKALHNALSLDDVLYEQYRRIRADIFEHEKRLNRKSRIARVVKKHKDHNEILQIISVVPTEDGTIIEVR